MKPNHTRQGLEATIFRKLSEGGSNKSVAKALGLSEWQVRTIRRKAQTHAVHKKVHSTVRLSKVVKQTNKVRKAVILSDIHIPEHDHKAVAIALAYMQDVKPDVIVLNGDILDNINTSRFPKDPHIIETFADELDETRAFLKLVSDQHPKATKHYVVGNHEVRIEKYLLEHAPALSSLPELSIDNLLHLREHGYSYVDGSDKVKLGNLEVFHGDIVKKDSGASARAHMRKRGGSVLIGHVHKLGVTYLTDRWGTHTAIENGHLSRPDPDYVVDPDWQQGFTEVHFTDKGDFSVRQHHILNGRLIVDGVVYG